MKKLFRRYKRYINFIFNYIFKEKIRGLDFTMRDTHLLKESKGKYHGYSITPEKHFKNIFSNLELDENCNFIDIGCGKGFVLWQASQYKFSNVLGIEIDERLVEIANKNINKLILKNVKVILSDAIEFNEYENYNYFFLFNPFPKEIFEHVFKKILKSLETNPRKITVIYYNPICAVLFSNSDRFILIDNVYDPIKDYDTFIYESI